VTGARLLTARRIGVATRNDVRLQWRQGFYGAYALVTALYVVLLRFTPVGAYPRVVPFLVFSDPAVFGFFFAGALVILERDDAMMQTLFVTPLGVGEYVAAKVLSLTMIAVATSVAIAAGAVGRGVDWRLLTAGVALTAALIIQIGIALASRFGTINRFMLAGSAATAILAAPLLPFSGIVDWPWVRVLPTHASLVLIGGAFSSPSPTPAASAMAVAWLVVCNAAAYVWARLWIERYGAGRLPPRPTRRITASRVRPAA
jgi:fluoroquinolone transport system permease protein